MSQTWRTHRERGSRNALRLIIWIALCGGRFIGRLCLVPISLYFYLTAPVARHASQTFITRATGHPAAWYDPFIHLYIFATTLLDRVYLINGRHTELHVNVINENLFTETIQAGRGCLILGSHLGSFEILSVIGSLEKKLPINIVMHLDQSAQLQKLVCAKKPPPYSVIPLGQPNSMLHVKECLERGEIVGILADRVYGDEPTQTLPFLGQPAPFSLSPWRLAKITQAPTLIAYGLFRGGKRYSIIFEKLSEPNTCHTAAPCSTHNCTESCDITRNLQTYISSLEQQARSHPYNWFNFYDYWGS